MSSEIDPASLVDANNAFGLELYVDAAPRAGNTAMSPASISSALAMTFAGARGRTAEEMENTLHFRGDSISVARGWGAMQRALTGASAIKVRIANRLFAHAGYPFAASFLELLNAAFGAAAEALDFEADAEGARVQINHWVEAQTEKRIKDLLPPAALTGLTRLVLVNAIYFLADWASPFEMEETLEEDFTVEPGKTKKVPMMHQEEYFPMARRGDVGLIELAYVKRTMSMLVFLPDRVDGALELERTLTAETLSIWRDSLKVERVDLALPRFEVSPPAIQLKAALMNLGMRVPFDPDAADFSGMGGGKEDPLHIDKVFHKAFVKVDEKGTEAAAATAVSMKSRSMPPPATPFFVDHPFVYAIVDTTTGLLLFIGRVTEP
jgi:serpin B